MKHFNEDVISAIRKDEVERLKKRDGTKKPGV
jgi:hypothetical protein